MAKQRILIIGHSFVRRLKVFVQKKTHMQAFSSLSGMADIYFHGVGGRTIAKFRKFDFNVVRQLVPDVIILGSAPTIWRSSRRRQWVQNWKI